MASEIIYINAWIITIYYVDNVRMKEEEERKRLEELERLRIEEEERQKLEEEERKSLEKIGELSTCKNRLGFGKVV